MWFTFTFTSIIITRFMNASFFNTPTFCKRNGSNKKFHNVNANLQVHFGIFESCTKVGYGQIITEQWVILLVYWAESQLQNMTLT